MSALQTGYDALFRPSPDMLETVPVCPFYLCLCEAWQCFARLKNLLLKYGFRFHGLKIEKVWGAVRSGVPPALLRLLHSQIRFLLRLFMASLRAFSLSPAVSSTVWLTTT